MRIVTDQMTTCYVYILVNDDTTRDLENQREISFKLIKLFKVEQVSLFRRTVLQDYRQPELR